MTYRTGNHHGITIVAEGDGARCGWEGHDCARGHLAAVVIEGGLELAERICALLNDAHTPDVDHIRGAAEVLALVADRIADTGGSLNLRAIREIIESVAAELGIPDEPDDGEDAPVSAPISPLTAEQVHVDGVGYPEPPPPLRDRVAERRKSLFNQPHSWTPNCGETCDHEETQP